jgi:hypothetical protein
VTFPEFYFFVTCGAHPRNYPPNISAVEVNGQPKLVRRDTLMPHPDLVKKLVQQPAPPTPTEGEALNVVAGRGGKAKE